jgi:hypothetical protein
MAFVKTTGVCLAITFSSFEHKLAVFNNYLYFCRLTGTNPAYVRIY